MEREAVTLEALSIAQAVKNSGGIVIVQVERITTAHMLNPREVQDPRHPRRRRRGRPGPRTTRRPSPSPTTRPTPARSGAVDRAARRCRSGARKVIARRARARLKPNAIVNLGIGMPEGMASVAHEEHVLDLITLTVEAGGIGGIPAGGLSFGAAANPQADHRPAVPVRLLRRRRAGPGLPRHGPGGRRRQRQRQQVRPAAGRSRRLHQHQPERQGGVLHRRPSPRGREVAIGDGRCRSSPTRARAQVPASGGAAHVQRRLRPPPRPARCYYVTERCVFRLDRDRAGARRDRARASTWSATCSRQMEFPRPSPRAARDGSSDLPAGARSTGSTAASPTPTQASGRTPAPPPHRRSHRSPRTRRVDR